MKICINCSKKIDDNITFCTTCGSRIFMKKSNKSFIILILIAVTALVALFGEPVIKYNYYVTKGNKEIELSQAVNYYKKALKLNYKKDLVDKISEKLKKDDNFEDTLQKLGYILTKEDFNKIYLNTYVIKATENFENKNYKTSYNYLEKAINNGYSIKTFKYYDDLIYMNGKNILSPNENIETEDYIIHDSDTRFLTIDDLSYYNKEELGFIRNEIFARYGFVFKTDKYNNYFSSKDWYSPNPYFEGNENDLNTFEKANIKLIKSLEDKL